MLLELFLIRVPELGGLGVQWTRTIVFLLVTGVTGASQIDDSAASGNSGLLVGLAQETLQAQEHALDIVHCAPLILQNIQADSAGEVDVRVVDGGLEEDGGRRVRVVVREGKGELQRQSFIGRLRRAGDSPRPGKEVAIGVGEGRDTGRGRHHKLHQLSLQAIRSK